MTPPTCWPRSSPSPGGGSPTAGRRGGGGGQREAAPAADEIIAVRDALGRLAPDDRELLALVAWDGLRADEAAAILNISAEAARQRLVRARRRLRAELDTAPDATTGNDGRRSFTPTDTWPRSALKR